MSQAQATIKAANDLHIVAVGASAGGLEAIHEFFDNIPDSTNLAFIIIQHLSSDYKSLLVELVAKHTHMQVLEARHQLQVQPGFVYVIPNDKILTISHGKLCLSEKEHERGPNLAIDTFLYSLAEDQKKKAIAVILSGTGTDGTKGAEVIKNCGGLVLVQEPSSAKFDGMPRSAIAAHVADRILAPAAMADEIYSYLDGNTLSQTPVNGSEQEGVNRILDVVYQRTSFDFHQYKPATILRRITRRMLQTKQQEINNYERLLQSSEDEAALLAKEFFIGVTSFFRDKEAFQFLYYEVFPQIVASKLNGDAIKIWVTACSTGQEAYSVAILLDKFLQQQDKVLDVKIFASDLDESAIGVASKGIYPLTALATIEESIVNTYFLNYPNECVVIPRIRKQIVFAKHNVLKDPPFIKNDLVTCRNLLIYLNPSLQQQVLSTLNFSLRKGGYLFLGPSENLTPIKDEVEEINSKWKIYRKQGNSFGFSRATTLMKSNKDLDLPFMHRPQKVTTATQLAEDFRKSMAEDFGFAAAYINENYEVKEVVGDFRRYLSLPDKVLNLNILRMVPTELSGILSTAFRKVIKENKKTSIKNIRAAINGTQRVFNILVQPPPATIAQNFIMVVFGEVLDGVRQQDSTTNINLLQQNTYVRELEEELKETRHNLQMAIEGLETTNEELQSSNEELQSANEELQSSNEELQSLNEELHTLNTEHQLRIKELVELNDDLNNYFRSTEIAQLFVDGNLRIRKFNPAATALINVIENDIGRPIDNISTNICLTNLTAEVQKVLLQKEIREQEIQLHNGNFYLMRILPYIRQDKTVEGAVITFVDISAVKNLNSIIRGVFDTSSNAILVFKAERNEENKITDFICTAANYAAEKAFKRKPVEVIGQSIKNNFPNLTQSGFFEKFCKVVEAEESLSAEFALKNNDSTAWFDVIGNKLQDGIIITFTNITTKKEAEEKLRKQYNELLRTKDSLKQLNTQLEAKVRERTKDLAQSEERFRSVVSATNDAIWDWNLVNNEMWWSDSFYTLFGYNPEDPNVKTTTFWLDTIHPEDRKRIKDRINDVIHHNIEKWVEHYRFKKADGSYAWVLNRANIMRDEFNTPYRMLGSMMDVTDLQEAEEQLKQKNQALQHLIDEFKFVTDFMPQIVWSALPDGYHDFFNQRWFEYTGFNYEQSIAGGWAAVLHPDDYERTWKVWNDSLRNGTMYQTEYRLRDKNGQYRWFLARAMPMQNEDGAIIKWFGTCTDIHDQKQLADILELKVRERTYELQQANKRLQLSNEELETSNSELLQFASVASHDLKEPLRKIHLFSHMIKDRYLKDHQGGAGNYIDRIISSSSRMTKLINDLLTYSRLSVNSLFEPVDLTIVMGEVLSDLELSIQEKQAVVKADPLPQIDAVPGQMRQVFQNLIFNALKFSKEDVRPEIIVTSDTITELKPDAPVAADGPYIRIQIKDNGIGFDPQYCNKIFTIFQQLHSRDKYEGTGIGLAITKKIIERHQGIITADSKVNEGTTFTIVLPIRQEN